MSVTLPWLRKRFLVFSFEVPLTCQIGYVSPAILLAHGQPWDLLCFDAIVWMFESRIWPCLTAGLSIFRGCVSDSPETGSVGSNLRAKLWWLGEHIPFTVKAYSLSSFTMKILVMKIQWLGQVSVQLTAQACLRWLFLCFNFQTAYAPCIAVWSPPEMPLLGLAGVVFHAGWITHSCNKFEIALNSANKCDIYSNIFYKW